MDISDVLGAAFLPTDGQASPVDLTEALAKAARKYGATIITDCTIKNVQIKDGRPTCVETSMGDIGCEILVNCCGRWAWEFGQLAGVNVPLVPVHHQYIITEPMEGITRDLPTLRDPDLLTYYKEEVGGLIIGGYEPNPIVSEKKKVSTRAFKLEKANWEQFQQLSDLAQQRVPGLATAGINQLLNGLESFTPDGNFILGEAPELENYFVGAGFNSFGITAGGGAGSALAEWIVGGEPPYDLWAVDIRRFGSVHKDTRWLRDRTAELYGKHYSLAFPHEEHKTGRPLRCSPLYHKLKAAGACFGEKLGWERPNWFAPEGVAPKDEYSFGRQNWFNHVAEEHKAVRERVGLFDQTSFAKFLMVGKGSEQALSWICANDITKPPGTLTYTQLLNSRGGIECDLTIARLDRDRFYIVTGTGFATHDFHWIQRNIPKDCDATLIDVTSSNAVLTLMGPRARDVLSKVCDDDISNEAFPFGTLRHITVAGAPATALRVTYVGELGWELHIPMEFAMTAYEALMAAGEDHGIANAGYRSIDSLRLEKGYRAWSADISPDSTPHEAGLGWAVKLRKEIPFLGRDALLEKQATALTKSLACFTVDDPDIVLLGRETIYRNGERAGWLSSAGFGHTLQLNIGYGYVRNPEGISKDYLASGSYELEVASERVPCSISLEPLYDPEMKCVKV